MSLNRLTTAFDSRRMRFYTDKLTTDRHGKSIDNDGMAIDADGKSVNSDGMMIDMDGKSIDSSGMTVDTDGTTFDQNGMRSDTDGMRCDTNKMDSDGNKMQCDTNRAHIDGHKMQFDTKKMQFDGHKMQYDMDKMHFDGNRMESNSLAPARSRRNPSIKSPLIGIHSKWTPQYGCKPRERAFELYEPSVYNGWPSCQKNSHREESRWNRDDVAIPRMKPPPEQPPGLLMQSGDK